MIIHFGKTEAEIDRRDAFKLRLMAGSVLEERPSFKTIKGSVEGEPAVIYTVNERRDSSPRREQLVVQSAEGTLRLGASDAEALKALIREAN